MHPYDPPVRFDADAVEVIDDGDGLPGAEVIERLRARERLIASLQAERFADMVELVDVQADMPGVAEESSRSFDQAAVELGAGLRMTRGQSESVLGLAYALARQQPRVLAAMRVGEVDESRAKVFYKELAVVSDDTLRDKVLDQALPGACELTTGQLKYKIQMLVKTVDQEHAAKRYAEAVAQRDVYFAPAPDGTVVVTGERLPADRALAARERINALAKAAKNDGDPRSMGQLRADVFLGLLNGDYPGPDAPQRRGVLELTVPLTTLIGLSQAPGELAGWAPVVADIARQVAEDQLDNATWRYTVTDEHGDVTHHGITRGPRLSS
jgi:Domain of unknown function (DUF222)